MPSWVCNCTVHNAMPPCQNVASYLSLNFFRIHNAIAEKLPIIDVDGSYLYRKQQALLHSGVQVAPLPPPTPPLAGWEVVTDSNVDTVSASIPPITSGKLHISVITRLITI